MIISGLHTDLRRYPIAIFRIQFTSPSAHPFSAREEVLRTKLFVLSSMVSLIGFAFEPQILRGSVQFGANLGLNPETTKLFNNILCLKLPYDAR